MEPQTRFCTSADGTRLAYATVGDGPPFLWVSPWGSSFELSWEESRDRIERLAQGRQLIHFDRRGVGGSQREVSDLSLEAHVADVAAIVDHLRLERFDLWGQADGAAVAVAYAAQHPERVSRLVLWAPYPRGEDIVRPGAARSMMDLIRENWSLARRAIADICYPSGPTERQRWFADYFRKSISPEIAARYFNFTATVDVTTLLPKVKSPTLVLHRRGDRNVPSRAGRDAASLIPDARFLALEGDTTDITQGDTSYIETLTEFLDEGRDREPTAEPEETGAFRTILFTDMEASTSLTQRLGDTEYRAKERELDVSLRAAIRDAGGTPVEGKVLGDGVMAVFTSARQAIDCAVRCRTAGESAALPLHLGIHAGDVLREGNNVHGGAVNIAARIADVSAPGEILVSDIVRGLARTSAGVSFDDRGERALKGIADAQRLFAVREA